ncbi:carbamate kinase [Candidatus Saccharibacteria bacterium]|nr:carbamate kinase [Candidatus Saccharibacteria bacterium]MBR2830808.1 carbamate kinase [Candidatus Saccharibacteria bacterium]
MEKKRIVLALGGNALQKNGEATAEAQKKIAIEVGETIAELANQYEIIVAHGNGPQVGNILIHEESASSEKAPAMPLETAVAMSQGQIGYWLTQAINNAFAKKRKNKKVVTIVSQVVVSRDDSAFKNPTKPIGQFYSEKEAKALAREKGWTVKEDAGRGWRRVVASPKPIDIVEKKSIKDLVEDGAIVIAAGGGGIPVIRTKILKRLKGIDAVIDKDYAAEKLAELVGADIFISVTAVPNVYINYGTPDQKALEHVSAGEINRLKKYGYFKAGSMLPKVEAAAKFAEKPGRIGIITDIESLKPALAGKAGTIITRAS